MEILSTLVAESGISTAQLLMLTLLLLFLPALMLFRARARDGKTPLLRSIPAYERLGSLAGLAAESGNPLSMTLGSGGIGQAATAETMAALDVLDHVGKQAATHGTPPLVTAGDATVLLAAQGLLQGSYDEQGIGEEYDHLSVRLVAPDPAAYAGGMMDILNNESIAASIMAGRFEDEYLLMAETAVGKGLEQVAGVSQPTTLPFVYATADEPILGEDLFAAGAYLLKRPAHLASLMTQDWMRVLLVLIVVAGIVVKTVTA